MLFCSAFSEVTTSYIDKEFLKKEISEVFEYSLNQSVFKEVDYNFVQDVFENNLTYYLHEIKNLYALDSLKVNIHYEQIKEELCQEVFISVSYTRRNLNERIHLRGTLHTL